MPSASSAGGYYGQLATEVDGEAFNSYILVEAEIVHLLSVAKIEAIHTPSALADPPPPNSSIFKPTLTMNFLSKILKTLAEDAPASSFLQKISNLK